MDNTKIAWCHATRNCWWGCTEVSPLCDQCYACAWDKRLGGNHWGAHGPRLYQPGVWKSIEKAQATAAKLGEVHTQFVMSMGDIFERSLPLIDRKGNELSFTTGNVRNRFFVETVPNSPNLYFLLLTKRPQNIKHMIPEEWLSTPPANVMYGTSVGSGNQALDDKMIAALLDVPGKHFLSCEPLLGRLNLEPWLHDVLEMTSAMSADDMLVALRAQRERVAAKQLHQINWVITGGESGPKARAFDLYQARALRDQCLFAGVPVFVKQMGTVWAKSVGAQNTKGEDPSEWPTDLRIQQSPDFRKFAGVEDAKSST